MTANQGLVMNMVILIVLMWTMGYGMARIMGIHGGYVGYTRRSLGKIWARHKQKIIWMTIGAVLALTLLDPHSP